MLAWVMSNEFLHIYECYHAYRACYGRKPRLHELARACGLKEWQCYAQLAGLRKWGLARGRNSGRVA